MSSIVELLPTDLNVPEEDADKLLELAYLVTAADGKLLDAELTAFRALAAKLRGQASLDEAAVDELLDRFAHHIEANEIEARMRTLAPSLPEDLHELAYKLALGIAFVDWDPADEEDRLHGVLGDALGIAPGRRAALSREVGLGGGKAK